MKKTLIIAFAFLSLIACDKPENRQCVKSAGDNDVKEIVVPTFNKLFLGPHLNFTLVQDTVEKVIISGGKNLLNFITTDVNDGLLRIENTNTCNFLRSYKKEVSVEIHLINLINVEFEGTKPLTCLNQLNLNDLTFVIRDGAGRVNLNLNANSLNAILTHGWSNYEFKGGVNFLRLEVSSNGFGDSRSLAVNDSLYVITRSTEDLQVNCDGALMRAEINSSGNIGYIGTPTFIELNNYGSGELIDEN